MKIIIVGCGRLGSSLATELSLERHEVIVVSKEINQFKLLDATFKGETITGIEFDKDVLESAHIKQADSLIACTEDDATNALIARIARNTYQVPKVIARLYDRRKVNIYNALGIEVIATTNWGIARAKELLTFNHLDSVVSFGNTPVEIVKIRIPKLLEGFRLSEAFPLTEVRVVALSRENQTIIPANGIRLQQSDILYLSVMPESMEKLKRILDL
ncbi:potassium channel family protein [Enterococcus sp. DIV0876]|uniref:potassium channel family protein n=1 Tax=Enterococcus sp. DIV0876 TaxID=2774633 RepID=UPI003D2FDD3B